MTATDRNRKAIRNFLQEVRTVLQGPEKWTQHVDARDLEGVEVKADEPRAVCWCLVGAMDMVALRRNAAPAIFDLAQNHLWTTSSENQFLCAFNDTHTHPEVLGLLDAAIATV